MEPIRCASCDSPLVRSTIVTEQFLYGDVVLEATFPLRTCLRCDFEFSDEVGEAARDAAVKTYLMEVVR